MKKSILTFLIAFIGISSVYAQTNDKKEVFSFANKKYLTEAGISEALQAKILESLKSSNLAIKQSKGDENLSEEEKASKMEMLLKERVKNIYGLLDADQTAKIKAIIKRIRETNTN